MTEITSHARFILETYPYYAYIIIGLGIFATAVFPLLFFWCGKFVLISAGILIWFGILDMSPVLFASVLWALLGDVVNYISWYRYGRKMFHKGKQFFNPETLARGEKMFQKYGILWVFFVKIIPFIPWNASFFAWLHKMNIIVFILVDAIAGCMVFGGIYWGLSVAVWFLKGVLHIFGI